jgi:hypothetical protein
VIYCHQVTKITLSGILFLSERVKSAGSRKVSDHPVNLQRVGDGSFVEGSVTTSELESVQTEKMQNNKSLKNGSLKRKTSSEKFNRRCSGRWRQSKQNVPEDRGMWKRFVLNLLFDFWDYSDDIVSIFRYCRSAAVDMLKWDLPVSVSLLHF